MYEDMVPSACVLAEHKQQHSQHHQILCQMPGEETFTAMGTSDQGSITDACV